MASFMPAACNPWAMDHAIERLLATPKTTALRPFRSVDMSAPYEWERITAISGIYHGGTETRRNQRHCSWIYGCWFFSATPCLRSDRLISYCPLLDGDD